VDLGERATDLGTVTLDRGATLRIRFGLPEGEAAPRAWLMVERIDAPAAAQRADTRGETTVAFRGMTAGRWRVTGQFYKATQLGTVVVPTREVEIVEGTPVPNLDVPLR